MASWTITKLFAYTIFFTLLFFFVKILQLVPPQSYNDASSLGWLYSVAGVIFGVLSGFVIQVKWSIWDKLVEASYGEITNIRQLHSVIHHLGEAQREKIKKHLKEYLRLTIKPKGEGGQKSHARIQASLQDLEESIYALHLDKSVTHVDKIAYELFRKLMDWHEKRVNLSKEHLLPAIRFFILANAMLLAILSLLLPVQSLALSYIFTLSISLLTYAVYLLIDDLDHPFRPGNWHLSTVAYSNLLDELTHF